MADHGTVWRYQADPLGVFLYTVAVTVAIGWEWMPWWTVPWSLTGLALELLPMTAWYLRLRDEGSLNL